MTAQQWRAHGYKVMFLDGRVYLVRPASGIVISAPIDNGRWMLCDNVNEAPWRHHEGGIDSLPGAIAGKIGAAVLNCYCGMGGVQTCDFCGGLRPQVPR